MSELADMAAKAIERKRAKSGQGMRQPQLGGILSMLDLTKPRPLCGHDTFWRKSPEHPWVCATCHPPAIKGHYEVSARA
jgi:hypothetical protein